MLASGRLRRTQAAAAAATTHSRQIGAILRLHGRKFREVSVSATPLRAVVVGAQLNSKVQPGQVIFVVPVGLHECSDGEMTVVAVERGNHEVAARRSWEHDRLCGGQRRKGPRTDEECLSSEAVRGDDGYRISVQRRQGGDGVRRRDRWCSTSRGSGAPLMPGVREQHVELREGGEDEVEPPVHCERTTSS